MLQMDQWQEEDTLIVETARKSAWEAYQAPIRQTRSEAINLAYQPDRFHRPI